MPLIADVTTCAYGPVQFTTYFHTKLAARPVPDASGRAVKWVEHTLDVAGVVEPDKTGTVNLPLSKMLQTLQTNGLALAYVDRLTDLVVNVPNPLRAGPTVYDVDFGPKVKLVEFQPLGGNPGEGGCTAAMVHWQCVVCLPECNSALYQNAICELTFEETHKIDAEGYSDIAIAGSIEIAMTRPGGTRQLPDHVDRYRQQVQTPVPVGFQREDFTWKVNRAKKRADFSWTDKQLRTPLPPGTVRCPLTYKVSAQGIAMLQWQMSLSGSIVVPPNYSKAFAWRVFLSVLWQRWRLLQSSRQQQQVAQDADRLRQAFNNLPPEEQALVSREAMRALQQMEAQARHVLFALPSRLEVSNEIAGRAVHFNFQARVIARQSLLVALARTGIWLNFPGDNGGVSATAQDWLRWRRSLEDANVTNVRGPSQIVWDQRQDAILDLCAPPAAYAVPHLIQSARPPARGSGRGTGKTVAENLQVRGARDDEDVDPDQPGGAFVAEKSYLTYLAELIYLEPRGRYARHKPLAGKVQNVQLEIEANDKAKQIRQALGGIVGSATADKMGAEIFQEVGAPTANVLLRIFAVRIGDSVPMPNLLVVKGRQAVLSRIVEAREKIVSRWGDLAIFACSYLLEYYLDRPPAAPLPSPANPVLGFDGG